MKYKSKLFLKIISVRFIFTFASLSTSLTIFAVTFFICRGTFAEDVSVNDLKAQIERMQTMLEEQQKQIGEPKRVLEEKLEIASPSARNDKEKEVKEAVNEEKIEEVVEKYLEKEETKDEFAKLGLLSDLNMGYKKGFYLETLDKKYKLQLNARVQFRYEYDDLEGKEDLSSFIIRRARLTASGYAVSPDIQYKLEVAADKGNALTPLYWYVDLRQLSLAMFNLGQDKVPFNRQHITSSGFLQFADRSIADAEFNFDFDTGIRLHGEPFNKRIEYALGVFNGSGLNKLNDNNKNLYVIRAVYNPFGEFGYESEYSDELKATIGGALAFNSKPEEIATGVFEDVDNTSTVLETGLKYRGFSFLTEYYYRHKDILSQDDQGFFAQAGYFIIPKRLELAGRYSLIAYDNNPTIDTKREMTAGLNYFFSGYRTKLQANYTRLGTDLPRNAGNDKQEDLFKLQYQFSF